MNKRFLLLALLACLLAACGNKGPLLMPDQPAPAAAAPSATPPADDAASGDPG